LRRSGVALLIDGAEGFDLITLQKDIAAI